jgi:hypothetical protein
MREAPQVKTSRYFLNLLGWAIVGMPALGYAVDFNFPTNGVPLDARYWQNVDLDPGWVIKPPSIRHDFVVPGDLRKSRFRFRQAIPVFFEISFLLSAPYPSTPGNGEGVEISSGLNKAGIGKTWSARAFLECGKKLNFSGKTYLSIRNLLTNATAENSIHERIRSPYRLVVRATPDELEMTISNKDDSTESKVAMPWNATPPFTVDFAGGRIELTVESIKKIEPLMSQQVSPNTEVASTNALQRIGANTLAVVLTPVGRDPHSSSSKLPHNLVDTLKRTIEGKRFELVGDKAAYTLTLKYSISHQPGASTGWYYVGSRSGSVRGAGINNVSITAELVKAGKNPLWQAKTTDTASDSTSTARKASGELSLADVFVRACKKLPIYDSVR